MSHENPSPTIECPHCNGLLTLKAVGQAPEKDIGQGGKNVLSLMSEWVNTPVTLSDLLVDMNFTGNMEPFEPLDQLVYLTAFRSIDFLQDNPSVIMSPEKLHFIARELPGWHNATRRGYFFGTRGRFWVRRGYESYPGVIPVSEFDDLI